MRFSISDRPCPTCKAVHPPIEFFFSRFSFASLCAADTALAEPSGVGGSASARYPQAADSVGNESARPFALNALRI